MYNDALHLQTPLTLLLILWSILVNLVKKGFPKIYPFSLDHSFYTILNLAPWRNIFPITCYTLFEFILWQNNSSETLNSPLHGDVTWWTTLKLLFAPVKGLMDLGFLDNLGGIKKIETNQFRCFCSKTQPSSYLMATI